jgi:hypothetical protein
LSTISPTKRIAVQRQQQAFATPDASEASGSVLVSVIYTIFDSTHILLSNSVGDDRFYSTPQCRPCPVCCGFLVNSEAREVDVNTPNLPARLAQPSHHVEITDPRSPVVQSALPCARHSWLRTPRGRCCSSLFHHTVNRRVGSTSTGLQSQTQAWLVIHPLMLIVLHQICETCSERPHRLGT